MDSRARFNQAAYLAQFVFADGHYACHLNPSSLDLTNYRRDIAAAALTSSGRASLLGSAFALALATRNCESASLSCSDICTSCSTVREVCRAPCEVWRVMLEIICIALATPSVPRTCCFEAREISCTSSADWRTTVEIASSARPAWSASLAPISTSLVPSS